MTKGKKIILSIALFVAAFFCTTVSAHAAVYYFNNAVNTSPTTLGNYWTNVGATTPAGSLPDTSVDEVTILTGATYAGDAIFNGTSTNEGTVDGNATFNDDSINNGTVTGDGLFNGDVSDTYGPIIGSHTRKYTASLQTFRDFGTDGPWIVIADGAGVVVDVSDSNADETTIFTALNGASFIGTTFGQIFLYSNKIFFSASKPLDPESIPDTSDFTVKVNGSPVSISSITFENSNQRVVVNLSTSVTSRDTVTIAYTPGSTPLQTEFGHITSPAISETSIPLSVPYGGAFYSFATGGKLYVLTHGSDLLHIIDVATNTLIESVSTGDGPYNLGIIGKKIYVVNQQANTATVIDTTNNTVTATVPVAPQNPYYASIIGTKMYANSFTDNKLSIIDTNTDIASVITAGATQTWLPFAVGRKVYISSVGKVAVVDAITNSVITTIDTPNGGNRFFALAGTKLYVTASGGTYTYVIDTITDTVLGTLPIGQSSEGALTINNKVYISNGGANTISVVNPSASTTGSVIATIPISDGSSHLSVYGKYLYVGGTTPNVIDTTTDTNLGAISPLILNSVNSLITRSGSTLYVTGSAIGSSYVFDDDVLPFLMPNLSSFSTPSPSASYHTGQSIPIVAHFGRTLASGSTMTVLLNSGASIVLNNVSDDTLSGTYIVGSGDSSPDLAVRSITSASVSDGTHSRTTYDLPSSQGDYTIFQGENSFITRNLGDAKNISINTVPTTLDTGSHPYQVSQSINGFIYVANQGAGTVSVINESTGTLAQTITVGLEPYGLALSGTTLYVANTGSDTVSAIDTASKTVVATISVGVKPYYVAVIGTKVYVTNGASNTVSVINALNNTVTATIAVGSYPRGIKAHGTDLYVANYGDPNYSGGNYISVINSLNNTVTDTILLPAESDGPRGVFTLGSKVYVTNFRSNNVSVIDTATNSITDTINVGMGPRGITGLGTTLYVENFDDGTISIIDTNSNTVTDTIDVGSSPAGMSISGTDIYVSSFQDDKLYVLDTTTNTLKGTAITVEEEEEEQPQTHGPSGGGTYTPPTPTDCLPGMRYSPSTGQLCPIISPTSGPTAPLIPTKPSSPPTFTRTLKLGSSGSDVKALQQYLNSHNVIVSTVGAGSPGKETTLFGTKTKLAVIKFQLMNKLKGDGIVGPMTRSFLK